jgi:ligand-binding SRPBCC domain-containing protein
MRYSYRTEQWLTHPAEEIFAFLANPGNLPSLMPAWQDVRIETTVIVPPPAPPGRPNPILVTGVGSRLTLSFLPFAHAPVRLHWQAEISEFVWNHHFCDRQLRGPFAFWKHCHYVRSAVQDGTDVTLVADDVEYELPGGFAGRLAHGLFPGKQIERMFAYRQSRLAGLFPTAAGEASQSPPHIHG